MDIAIDNYIRGKTSLEQSSKIAGVTIWNLLEELRKRKAALKYSIVDADEEIQRIINKKRSK
ncbi:MAG: UPF0175 family protein [Thaumarchaeota archaeon]|nr:UPF0175 family protein [Nitrososphaerota archaeon]